MSEEVYVVDASSLITLEGLFTGDAVAKAWKKVYLLAEEGRLKTSEFVFKEVERNSPIVYERIQSLRESIIVRIDDVLLREAGRITHTYPNMSHARRDEDSGDPWLVAIAKLGKYTVICEESPAKVQRIPSVCTKEGVRCGNIHELLSDEAGSEKK